jgi:hypothetical protein
LTATCRAGLSVDPRDLPLIGALHKGNHGAPVMERSTIGEARERFGYFQMQAQATESGGDVALRIHLEDLGTGEKRDFASVAELGQYIERWSGRSDASRFAPPPTGRA